MRLTVRLTTRLTAALALAVAGTRGALGAQGVAPAARPDSARAYTFEQFARQVRAHHPVARQARLSADHAREEVRVARGAFDPTVSASWDQKTFGGTEYYDYLSAALRIPTPLGADLKIGYERADGRYISADRRTPERGLVTAGLSIPLGQRLLTDERRNALTVARALRGVADADRAAALNRLLLGAAKDYGRWYEAARRLGVAQEGVTLAAFRLRAVRARVLNGDAAAIDTVEALVELQRRQVQAAEAEQSAFATTLTVTAYLWDARGAPIDLPERAAPVAGVVAAGVDEDPAAVAQLVARAERQHPDLRKVDGRVDQAEAQRQLARQQVIPFAEAELSSLANRRGEALGSPFATDDDYKAGLTVRTPLLFMKERGRFNAATLRLEQQEVERSRVRREIGYAVRVAVNDLATVGRLLGIQRTTVEQARLLRDGEQRKFENGESTLFLVNARDRLVLDEQLKLAALEARALGARAELAVSVGDAGELAGAP